VTLARPCILGWWNHGCVAVTAAVKLPAYPVKPHSPRGRLPMHGVHERPATARGVASGVTLLMVHGVIDYTGSGGHARGLRPRLQPGVAPNL
jgi:hypothetical protein